jgi:hypothetical protein
MAQRRGTAIIDENPTAAWVTAGRGAAERRAEPMSKQVNSKSPTPSTAKTASLASMGFSLPGHYTGRL